MKFLKSKRDQSIALAGGLTVLMVLCGYLWYVVTPLASTVSGLSAKIKEQEQALQQIQQLTVQEPRLREEYEQLSSSMQSLRTSMPAEQELASVIEQLSGMATQAGVKIQTIFPQRSLESLKVVAGLDDKKSIKSKLFKEIPIQIEALTGFHQLGRFLGRVERGRQPMHLKSLRITSNPKELKRHTVEMVLIAYFAVSDTKQSAALPLSP